PDAKELGVTEDAATETAVVDADEMFHLPVPSEMMSIHAYCRDSVTEAAPSIVSVPAAAIRTVLALESIFLTKSSRAPSADAAGSVMTTFPAVASARMIWSLVSAV